MVIKWGGENVLIPSSYQKESNPQRQEMPKRIILHKEMPPPLINHTHHFPSYSFQTRNACLALSKNSCRLFYDI